MAKLKPLSIGLSLGITLPIIYTIRTIVLLLFPNFVLNASNKVMYRMISIQLPVITVDSFVIGIIALFICGLILGIVFALVYNWVGK